MKWTKEANEALTRMWNAIDFAEYSDKDAADYFGTTTWAVAKQRSNIGLVSHARAYHTRDAKAVKEPLAAPPFVLYYEKDGQTHFSKVDADDEFKAKHNGRLLMYKLGLKEVILLRPAAKLINNIIEQQL